MQPMSVLLALAGVLGAASWRSEMEPVLRQPQRAVALLPPLDALHHLTRLRGGADDEDDLLEEDEESDDALAESDGAGMDGLENPFLQGAQGAMGGGIQDLAASLKDPKVLQEALKELQDPATQQRIKAMMEDPEFLSSMKQYVEQITADPQFEALKKQTESLMQEPDFVEQMTKAMMGGDMSKTLADMGAALGGAGEGEEEDK